MSNYKHDTFEKVYALVQKNNLALEKYNYDLDHAIETRKYMDREMYLWNHCLVSCKELLDVKYDRINLLLSAITVLEFVEVKCQRLIVQREIRFNVLKSRLAAIGYHVHR